MTKHHYLVMGARGFIGAWICRLLVEEGASVVATDASSDSRSVDCVLSKLHLDNIDFRVADARDSETTDKLFDANVTNVVYLAGLLRPASEQNPLLNSQVSIGGLINVLSASAKRRGEIGLAYASTAAVYGTPSNYPGKRVSAESRPAPRDHYGTARYAMEMTARVFASDNGVRSVGLRPWVVYGAGRFNGLTAQPSLAMLATAGNAPFHMEFGGRIVIHHAREVAKAFIESARADLQGSTVANIPGDSIEMTDLIDVISACVPESRGKITCAPKRLESIEVVDDPRLEKIIGPLPALTELRVRETIDDYRQLLAEAKVALP
jgi:nucleoside-diphosphate-sugar epimerase